ncbi:TSUP family transporter [Selenomonas sp. TAMA-11512]|uniref:sulfite exporter TauE/SafE family protein n=1 Tax=Selenomonas sp. TAMA-11512 TaxID=3095337 RepID=UPI003091C596|nr:TSUP family transporter [Selenomonas sp. TAMA-11512]
MGMEMLIFICVMGFFASFIDAVVGGGGLISIPALMMTGMPLLHVLGTNKAAAVMGACTSFISFIRSGKVDLKLIRLLFPFTLVGSVVGVLVVRQVPPDFLRPLVVVMLLLVLLYSVFRRDWGRVSKYHGMTRRMLFLSAAVAFTFGFYDGFFGPGTGSFLLFAFLIVGFDFLGAAANARALNFASNLAAVLLFAYFGLIDFTYAIPMGISMIAGAWCGTRLAIKKGASYVRPLFIIVTAVLIGKQLFDLFLK